jgi:hypothetical protein
MTQIVTPTETITVNLDDYNFLPPEISSIVLSIGRKFFGSPARWSFVRTTEYHTTHKNKWGSPDGKWPVFHTNAQTLRTNTPHSNNGLHRVAITLSGYSNFKYVHNAGCSQAVAWSDRGTKQEAERSLTILNSKLYQFILNTYKYSGWNSLDIIKALPFVNVSTGTDSEIYALFSLTPDEIQLVESGV